ncbi:MAG: hypothetical protein HS126_40265 [Anaerolineales bacterium]|nr:hypothetical protein [Anaerolineales bacterium]
MSGDLNITAEELKLFEEFYRRRLAEAGQVRDDSEELAVARDILQAVVNDGLTPTADGGASYVRRGARDWTDPTTVQAAQATLAGSSDTGGWKGKKRKNGRPTAGAPVGGPARSKEMLQGLGMLGAVLAIAGWFLWPTLFSQAEKRGDDQDGNSATSVSAQAAEGDESGEYTLEEAGAEGLVGPGTPAPTLETELLADIIDAGGVKTGPVVPRTLEIKGVSYIVQPVLVQAGDWPRPEDPRAASWVYGTVVNYALGLEATPENKKLLASLSPGDEILLRMSTGPTFRFAYADAVRVSPQASEIFAQVRPGWIIALLGDEGQPARIIIRAVYLPGRSESGGETAPVMVVSLGETTQVGESLRLTCLGYEPRVPPGVPPGYVHLEVQFVVENRLDDTLMTNTFAHQVIVADLTYPAITHVGAGQAAGAYPGLPAALAKGQVFTSTAIYAIPEVALKEELLWQFAPDPAGQVIQVLLPPYQGRLEPTVSVKSIEMQEGGVLAIKFAMQAPDLHALEISAADLKVEGAALAPAGNAFPWRLAAGERGEFSLFLIPEISPVTVGLLGQGFEITWRGGDG